MLYTLLHSDLNFISKFVLQSNSQCICIATIPSASTILDFKLNRHSFLTFLETGDNNNYFDSLRLYLWGVFETIERGHMKEGSYNWRNHSGSFTLYKKNENKIQFINPEENFPLFLLSFFLSSFFFQYSLQLILQHFTYLDYSFIGDIIMNL